MSNPSQTHEIPGQNPDPIKLLQDLETLDTDQKRNNHLRSVFLEVADVDQFLADVEADEDLTKKQTTKLKAILEGFKVYLKDYLEQTGKRIGRFEARNKENLSALEEHVAEPEVQEKLFSTRRRISKAMQIAKAPRGSKGKSLREVSLKGAESASEKKLDPEAVEVWLGQLKARFDAIPKLHEGIKWADVEKALRADPDAMLSFSKLDEKGHKMNVFGEEKGEFIFASGWENYSEVAPDHRNIAFDTKGQKIAEKEGYKPNGNAVSIIAKIMGVEEDEAGNYLADSKFHRHLINAINVNGWAWLKTEAATRNGGLALDGYDRGVRGRDAYGHNGDGSFRAARRVKKVA